MCVQRQVRRWAKPQAWVQSRGLGGAGWWRKLPRILRREACVSWGHPFPQGVLWAWFSSVQSLSYVRLFVDPMDCSTPGFPIHHQLLDSADLLKLTSMELVMPSNHLVLCLPLLLLPSIFPSIRVFSNESALHIMWPKCWSFSFSISPSNEYSGLISFRIDWLVWSPCCPRDSQAWWQGPKPVPVRAKFSLNLNKRLKIPTFSIPGNRNLKSTAPDSTLSLRRVQLAPTDASGKPSPHHGLWRDALDFRQPSVHALLNSAKLEQPRSLWMSAVSLFQWKKEFFFFFY